GGTDEGNGAGRLSPDIIHQMLHIAGSLRRRFRQRLDLAGDDGETLSMFPRAGGFNAGVQGQKVRFSGDSGDGGQKVPDLVRGQIQLLDHLSRGTDGGFDLRHSLDLLADGFDAIGGGSGRFIRIHSYLFTVADDQLIELEEGFIDASGFFDV